MGRKSRNKGQRGEREFAQALMDAVPCTAHRGRQYHGRDDAPDVQTDIAGVHWEVKRTETLSLYTAMRQAISDAGSSVPVVAHRRNNQEWLVVLRLADLPELARIIREQVENEAEPKMSIDLVEPMTETNPVCDLKLPIAKLKPNSTLTPRNPGHDGTTT